MFVVGNFPLKISALLDDCCSVSLLFCLLEFALLPVSECVHALCVVCAVCRVRSVSCALCVVCAVIVFAVCRVHCVSCALCVVCDMCRVRCDAYRVRCVSMMYNLTACLIRLFVCEYVHMRLFVFARACRCVWCVLHIRVVSAKY